MTDIATSESQIDTFGCQISQTLLDTFVYQISSWENKIKIKYILKKGKYSISTRIFALEYQILALNARDKGGRYHWVDIEYQITLILYPISTVNIRCRIGHDIHFLDDCMNT